MSTMFVGPAPWPEIEYTEGRNHLTGYAMRLADREVFDAQFYARADNLRYWLGTVEKRLGSLSQRLSASVGQRRINTDLAGAAGASQSTDSPQEIMVKTSWLKIDDVFYEARGTSWALVHFLKAIEIDFQDVLEKKNARASVQANHSRVRDDTAFHLFADHRQRQRVWIIG